MKTPSNIRKFTKAVETYEAGKEAICLFGEVSPDFQRRFDAAVAYIESQGFDLEADDERIVEIILNEGAIR